MSRPTVSALAEDLYELLGGLGRDDEAHGWGLLILCDIVTAPFVDLADVLLERDGVPGWQRALNLDTAPSWALPWLAQFGGMRTIDGLSDEQQREWIRTGGGMNRGTLEAITAAARSTLTGARRVEITERNGGAYRITIVTFTTETPDPAYTAATIRAVIPAGLIPTIEVHDGQSWAQAQAKAPTWNQWIPMWGTWDNVRNDL